MKRYATLALLLFCLASSAGAVRIECITANTIQTDANCSAEDTPWDCCTGSGTGNCDDLSASAIRIKGGGYYSDIEVYSTADVDPAAGAPAVPTTCAVGGSITCDGWDGSGAAQIWTKCDRRAPWLQMSGTGTYTGAAKVGASFDSDCLVALRVSSTGDTGDVCLYLSVVNDAIDNNRPDGLSLSPFDKASTTIQDGSPSVNGDWGEINP